MLDYPLCLPFQEDEVLEAPQDGIGAGLSLAIVGAGFPKELDLGRVW